MIYFYAIEFIVGIFLLYQSSNYLIDNGSLLARKYNISKIFIGMTLLACGTSLPELIVSLVASYKGEIDLVVGNVLGSNIANTGLVFGICALLYKIECNFREISLDVMVMFLSTSAFCLILFFKWFDNLSGIILLLIFFLYMYTRYRYKLIVEFEIKVSPFTFELPKNNLTPEQYKREKIPDGYYRGKINLEFEDDKKLIFFIIIGIVGLSLGSNFLVDSAIGIAQYFKISSMIIGVTAVALGTSLPELATSLNAAKKKEFNLLLGNILGSNIINIIFVFGSSLLINQNRPEVDGYIFEIIILLSTTAVFIASLKYMSPAFNTVTLFSSFQSSYNSRTTNKFLSIAAIILLIMYIYFILTIFL